MLKNVYRFKIPDLVGQVILSWLLAVTIEYLLLPEKFRVLEKLDGVDHMSFARVIFITFTGTIFLNGISYFSCLAKTTAVKRWSMAGIFIILAITALCASFSWAFLVVCILIAVGLMVFGIYGWDQSPESAEAYGKMYKMRRKEIQKRTREKTRRICLWITVGLSIIFFLFVSAWTVGRVYSFSTPTFDFGIFSQMFYNMKKFGLPMTTVERDGLLSHFNVHMSPIYYLLLPFYWFAPTPAVLQILQAAVITSAVIPLWKIAKHHGFSDAQRMFVCALLLVYPAFSGGTGYDIHENCFLTPLLLWLFYGIDRKNTAIILFSVLLTLMVKEDTAVYVAVIALWLIGKTILRFEKMDFRNLMTGIVMLAISLVWFFLVISYLAESGDGVMTYRYNNFMYDHSSSLVTVVQSVILNPMKTVYECVDIEKLWFIAMTLFPLLGLPLLTRRYERYILLIPYILVNLMPDYQYQHNIFFQYTFGSTACLMYLTVINLADLKIKWKRTFALIAAVIVSVICFSAAVVPKAISYPVKCIQNFDSYQEIRDVLSGIPDDASVTATTFYTTFLSQREILYDAQYSSKEHMLETEYVVLGISEESSFEKYAVSKENGFENLVKLLEQNGYEMYVHLTDVLVFRQVDTKTTTANNRQPFNAG